MTNNKLQKQIATITPPMAAILLTAIALLTPGWALGQSQKQARHLTDSLTTVYEGAEESGVRLGTDPVLDDYLAYAASQSPALKASFYRWKSLVEKSDYTGSRPDPTLSYGYFVESVETRVGPQVQRLSLRQAFPWFGTLGAKKDASTEAAWSAYEKFESEKLRLFYQIKAAYYDYYFLGRNLAIARENFELLTFWEAVASAKYRVALTQHTDVIKAQVELGKLEDQILSLEDMLEPAATRLRMILDLPDSVDVPLPTEIYVEEVSVDGDSVLTLALRNNPDLKSAARLIEKENAERRLAGKMSWPNFSVGLDFIDTGPALDPTIRDSGKDAWIVSAGLSVPLWFGKNKARKREAEARHRAAQYEYSDARNHLETFTEKVVFEYEDALRKTRLYRDGLVPKAEQALNSSYTAYQAGEMDFLNVLDAQRQLLDFQLMFEQARADLAVHRAEIEMITARELGAMRPE
jgi:outer membrane protein TolC